MRTSKKSIQGEEKLDTMCWRRRIRYAAAKQREACGEASQWAFWWPQSCCTIRTRTSQARRGPGRCCMATKHLVIVGPVDGLKEAAEESGLVATTFTDGAGAK